MNTLGILKMRIAIITCKKKFLEKIINIIKPFKSVNSKEFPLSIVNSIYSMHEI